MLVALGATGFVWLTSHPGRSLCCLHGSVRCSERSCARLDERDGGARKKAPTGFWGTLCEDV